MEAKKNTKNNFFKKNIYYFVLAFVILAVVAISVALFVRQEQSNPTLNSSGNNQLEKPNSSTGGTPPDSSSQEQNPPEEKPNDTPTQTVISFIMPVDNSTIICDYTATSVVYNQTLNVYTGHLAIDFGADYGKEVKAVYTGKIESVVTSYLTGTTVTVDHGNNLKSVYNGLELADGIAQGVTVAQGTVLGFVSDNNRQEYKDGPHLHFEVWENGKKISPYQYLTVSEK